jgi:hypothetical protein
VEEAELGKRARDLVCARAQKEDREQRELTFAIVLIGMSSSDESSTVGFTIFVFAASGVSSSEDDMCSGALRCLIKSEVFVNATQRRG